MDEATAYFYRYNDLPASLPVFPIEDVLLLPHGTLPLNIFEDRYIQLCDDALRGDRLIGMIQPANETELEAMGCVGRITDFHHMQDGRYMVSLYGLYRFDVVEELSTTTPYRKVKPRWDNYKTDMICEHNHRFPDRDTFETLLSKYFDKHDMVCDRDKVKTTPCHHLVTTLSMVCPFSAQEKQMLLMAETFEERANTLMRLIEMAIHSTGNKLTH